ncbi:VOC family protein [Pelagibius litoralis]|uniref:VOC family protein n=1 Tax=Pelagibius litoralis TaxID=374515 RepID=A0A967C3N7_9PROT|nr:VOC family protein [Pelagibius litoralis]NIA67884.1 VOC family protein [Pelagibius litoralis]
MTSEMDLDHVAVVVGDLDRAERNYTRLGFQLTPRSSHKGPVAPDGEIGPWGSGNHCAMFRQGYLELLGITDADLYKAHIDRRLARYEGLHLIAFGTDDAGTTAAALGAKGVRISAPAQLGRDVPYGEGTRPGKFSIANLDEALYPEADFIVIEQQTRGVLWQPALMEHPNGALSLESVTLCCSDPDDLVARLTPALGGPRNGRFDLTPGVLAIISAKDLADRLPDCAPPGALPCVVATAIGVRSLRQTEDWLVQNDVPLLSTNNGCLRVGSETGCGAVIEFIQSTLEESGQ